MNREEIHPYVAITIEYIKDFGEKWKNVNEKVDENTFPVCFQVSNINHQILIDSKDKSSSIKILRSLIKKEIAEYSKKKGHIVFKLAPFNDKYVRNSLIDLERDFKDLEESQEVVICCPLHFLDYLKRIKLKYNTEDFKILKLIHVVNFKGKKNCKELVKFYHDYNSKDKIIVKNLMKIQFYRDVSSLAKKWFKIIVEKYISNATLSAYKKQMDQVKDIPTFRIVGC